ncbi:MAG: methylated-DNA--protein-cysteine methyltransferase [bacterium]|nr:MAG: methylated-DNA--protein-cysteine methyltransferase [bacterium]
MNRLSLLYYTTIGSPVGEIFIASKAENSVSIIQVLKNQSIESVLKRFESMYQFQPADTDQPIFSKVIHELKQYFQGDLNRFSVQVDLRGTAFQKQVWNALLKIPSGETVSYKTIAINIGNEKAARAVGHANNRNPIPIIVPCHRVIGQNGALIGYRGGLILKEWLIQHEKTMTPRVTDE